MIVISDNVDTGHAYDNDNDSEYMKQIPIV